MSTVDHHPSQSFSDAAVFLANAPSSSRVSSELKLELYGLYKHISVSPYPNTGRPGLFDMVGRAKWDAWKATYEKYGDRYADVESRYIDIARQFGWTDNAEAGESSGAKTTGHTGEIIDRESGEGLRGMGFAVSTLVPPVNEPESASAPTIHTLALSDDADRIAALLKADPTLDVNGRDEFGYTPLHLASDRGCEAAVELLLRFGANPTIKDPDDFTALELASVAGHENTPYRKQTSDCGHGHVEKGGGLQ